MDAVSDTSVLTVVLMCSAQVGKTEIINNTVGFYIDLDPSPILLINPTLEMSSAWSKDRFAPMLRDTPCLKGKVEDARARDSGNTILHKTFKGGHITMAGANSPASLAARPVRIVLLDEVDRFPPSAGAEGDPVNLARKRSTTFWNRKTVMCSTPTIKGESRIEAAFEESDKRYYQVPCHACGEFQSLKWANVKWSDGPDSAHYMCEHCGVVWTDAERAKAVSFGHWEATAEFNGIAGFHLNEIYSPWVTLSQMVDDFLKAKKFPETLKTWINTALGETWEDKGETVEPDSLLARREPYDHDLLPEGIVLLTAGVDVQGDRLEAEIVGWGSGEESWGVEYRVFRGDPDQVEIWNELDEWLLRKFETETGLPLRIEAVAVDASDKPDRVYRFTGPRKRRRVWAIKGMAGPGKPIWPKKQTRGGTTRSPLFIIGVDTAKDLIYGRLNTVREDGPGYMHFPADYDAEYFAQLTAETVKTKYKNGRPYRVWHQRRDRNEALDCRVYAYAAMLGRNVDLSKRSVEPKENEPPAPQPTPAQQLIKQRRQGIRRSPGRGGFVGGFK